MWLLFSYKAVLLKGRQVKCKLLYLAGELVSIFPIRSPAGHFHCLVLLLTSNPDLTCASAQAFRCNDLENRRLLFLILPADSPLPPLHLTSFVATTLRIVVYSFSFFAPTPLCLRCFPHHSPFAPPPPPLNIFTFAPSPPLLPSTAAVFSLVYLSK